ncbi:unnamed protein product [Rotaria socialis]|uniref:PB1 domain-containing protein n=1 Tax=Rotaria socialis TaxID=392032 RepID=A0A817UJB7_9BILA|nr:unnamed protein product [Rotaria socialis]CAF4597717.1 unnamed protein product [Rotaria socialis]
MNGLTNVQLSASSTPPNSDKLSGKLIIKAQLGDDTRKMMIHNEDLTLNELVLMMERIFAGKISNSDELTIKYLDDDGDKITLLNDSDLTVALNFHKVLRVFVLVNGSEQFPNNSTDNVNKEGSLVDAKTFRTELQQIRNSVQAILDRLQLPTNQEEKNKQQEEATTKASTPVFVPSSTREFDPYKHLQTQRSTTPDSIRSRLSNSNKIVRSEQKSFQATQPVPTVNTQQQYQPSQTTDSNKAPPPPTSFQQTQIFAPTGYNDQQNKTSTFGGPQSPFPPMPTLPNVNTSSAFNTSSAPPLPSSNTVQTSAFIGQQQFQPVAPPPQSGFYSPQSSMQQKSFIPGMNTNMNSSNAYAQQQAPPPSGSSPATINPSYIQSTGMPVPPQFTSQQPYGGYPPQNSYYNPASQYSKTS